MTGREATTVTMPDPRSLIRRHAWLALWLCFTLAGFWLPIALGGRW